MQNGADVLHPANPTQIQDAVNETVWIKVCHLEVSCNPPQDTISLVSNLCF